MSDHLLRMVGLSKDKVQQMMSQRKTVIDAASFDAIKSKKVKHAYQMVVKGSSVATACQSWGVNVKEFNAFAMENKLPLASNYIQRNPSKSQAAYEDAFSMGVQPACRKHGVSRYAMYAYARRYGLETPTRARYK